MNQSIEMVSRTPTYDAIIALTRQLSNNDTKTTKRRQIASDLERQLSNYSVRKQLADEVSPGIGDYSTAVRRCKALQLLWSNALNASIHTVKSILKTKTKLSVEDIRLPYKILRASSQPDYAFDTNGIGLTKLPKKSVRNALKFCLEMLQNEKVLEVKGEENMIDMLYFLCSRDEYVGYFKYMVDFQNILTEIFFRIREDDDEMVAPIELFEASCKVFDALFSTCNRLGIQNHIFISDSLEVVSRWCKKGIQENSFNSTTVTRQHFFNATATILYSHPEHSIGPMKRYGRHILRYCKKAYPCAQGHHKDALNKYLLSHL